MYRIKYTAPHKNPLFQADAYPILIMELLGDDLFIHINKRDDIDLFDISQAFRSAMLGLQSIHKKNFLHRDLKIDNIVMASEAATSDMKIIDFGMMISVEDTDVGVTTEHITGTNGSFAPETLLRMHYSAKSDIW